MNIKVDNLNNLKVEFVNLYKGLSVGYIRDKNNHILNKKLPIINSVGDYFNIVANRYFLILKDLKNITKKDLEEICNILEFPTNLELRNLHKEKIITRRDLFEDIFLKDENERSFAYFGGIKNIIFAINLLRKKGYYLPYMGIDFVKENLVVLK